jgi:hypothetical protein
MRRHCDWDPAFDRERVALRLIAVMMRVQNPIDIRDPKVRKMSQNAAGAEVDQDTVVAIPDDIDVASVFKDEKIG